MLGEADFISWAPNHIDSYVFPSGWALEPKSRQSAHIATWRAQAQNMSKMFAAVYWSGQLNGRFLAVDDIRPFARVGRINIRLRS